MDAANSLVTIDVTTVLFTSNLIGILFARSLHYQFYSWYAHQIPFLAWRTKYPVYLKLVMSSSIFSFVTQLTSYLRVPLLLGIEYAWNVFPSTPISSSALCFCNLALLGGVWFGFPEGKDTVIPPSTSYTNKKPTSSRTLESKPKYATN